MTVIGAAGGSMSLAQALREGVTAGAEAARAVGLRVAALPPPRTGEEATRLTPLWYVAESGSKAFVDFQHDVMHSDVALAAREGFRSVEHLKRYTTLAMATDQGKSSSVNGYAIIAALTGRTIPETGTTVFRPAVHTRRHRRVGRPPSREIFPTDAADGGPWLGRRAGGNLRGSGPMAARAMVSCARHTGLG